MRKILVAVDWQNDFVNGSLGFAAAAELEKLIEARLEQAVQDGEEIVHTKDTHGENYLETQEGKRLPVRHTIEGTPGWEIYGEKIRRILKEHSTEFKKAAFGSLEFGLWLRDENKKTPITEIEFCGVVTNMCVISNAVIAKATLPEARIVINANLCSSFDLELHHKALAVMTSMQMDIV